MAEDFAPMTTKHEDILKKHFEVLSKNLVADGMLSKLVSSGVIGIGDMEALTAEKVPRTRTQQLLFFLAKQGDKAFYALISACWENNMGHLAKLLEDDDNDPHWGNAPAAVGLQGAAPLVGGQSVPGVSQTADIQDEFSQYDQIYTFEEKQRGKALIICIAEFDDKKWNAPSNTVDRDNLASLCRDLDIDPFTVDDLPAKDIEEEVKRFAKPEAHKNSRCAVLALLSHGQAGDEILGRDGVGVSVETLCSYFSSKNCPPLKGKPKLTLVQACRGGEIPEKVAAGGTPTSPAVVQPVSFMANGGDEIIAYATQKGYMAWMAGNAKNEELQEGSDFINAVTKILKARAGSTDMLHMLTMVVNMVSDQCGVGEVEDDITRKNKRVTAVEMPRISSSLRRKWYLTKQSTQ